MTIAEADDPEIPGLTAAARDHLRRELGTDGERAIHCLATANALLLEGPSECQWSAKRLERYFREEPAGR